MSCSYYIGDLILVPLAEKGVIIHTTHSDTQIFAFRSASPFIRADLLVQALLFLLQDVGDIVSLRRVLGMPPLLLLQICNDLRPTRRGDTESGMRKHLASSLC